MQNATILVVEHDPLDRLALVGELRREGHTVDEAATASVAISRLRERVSDLVVLDWDLPDQEGVELLRGLKCNQEYRATRVLMTSGRGHSEDVAAALKAGADDFLTKPLSMVELRARVAACLRRPPVAASGGGGLNGGQILLDELGHRLMCGDTRVELAPREFRLLQFFMSNPDRLYSRRQIMSYVWDNQHDLGERTVDVHVRRLRRILERFDCQHYIQTVRSGGYRFSINTVDGAAQRANQEL